jgi:hypothetical protein
MSIPNWVQDAESTLAGTDLCVFAFDTLASVMIKSATFKLFRLV